MCFFSKLKALYQKGIGCFKFLKLFKNGQTSELFSVGSRRVDLNMVSTRGGRLKCPLGQNVPVVLEQQSCAGVVKRTVRGPFGNLESIDASNFKLIDDVPVFSTDLGSRVVIPSSPKIVTEVPAQKIIPLRELPEYNIYLTRPNLVV